MCIGTSYIWVSEANGSFVKQRVACRECWQCRLSRVNDFVGRSLAEASCSSATCAITLTYRNEGRESDLAERFVTPRHFQSFVRALRKRGHSVRYLVAGEYGARKGRAHFHAVLFFQDAPPRWAHKVRVWDDCWPHGHMWVDWCGCDAGAVRYVAKYFFKDAGREVWLSMSKKPPLGASFFEAHGQRFIDSGVVPRSFDYSPPGARPGSRYTMTGVTRWRFMARMRDAFGLDLESDRLSEWQRLTLEKLDRLDRAAHEEQLILDKDAFDEELAGRVASSGLGWQWQRYKETMHNERILEWLAQDLHRVEILGEPAWIAGPQWDRTVSIPLRPDA